MANISSQVATKEGVVEYLTKAYQVDVEEAKKLVDEDKHNIVQNAIFNGSFNYYPGDQIAREEGLPEREGYDPDADDGDGEEE